MVKTKTQMLTVLTVWLNDERVGSGWVIYDANRGYRPELIDNEGNSLTKGWYRLEATEQHLVVTVKGIH